MGSTRVLQFAHLTPTAVVALIRGTALLRGRLPSSGGSATHTERCLTEDGSRKGKGLVGVGAHGHQERVRALRQHVAEGSEHGAPDGLAHLSQVALHAAFGQLRLRSNRNGAGAEHEGVDGTWVRSR